MLLPKIIAQAMAFVSALLDKWVDASATVSVASNCYDFTIYNVTLTDCGLEQTIDIVEVLQTALNLGVRLDVLWGFFTYSLTYPYQPPP
jgi:hypothetical protein